MRKIRTLLNEYTHDYDRIIKSMEKGGIQEYLRYGFMVDWHEKKYVDIQTKEHSLNKERYLLNRY